MIPSDGPPSAAPDPSPPVPDDEGGRWVLVPATEAEGADAPEFFHWEDLQQELARLSSALRAAGGRKGGLAARLHSALEVTFFSFSFRGSIQAALLLLLGSCCPALGWPDSDPPAPLHLFVLLVCILGSAIRNLRFLSSFSRL
jgi:hypothetical protein